MLDSEAAVTPTPYNTARPTTTGARRGSHLLALALIGLFLVVGIAYSLVVPPFETPDEPFHYAFARHIAAGNGLPVQMEGGSGPWAQEGSQAPLYYLITGALTAGIDQGDYPEIAVRNPRANIGDPLNPGNKNFMLYSGRQPPLQGSNLALHIGRWFSLLLGAFTLWCTYLTAALIGAALRSRPDRQPDARLLPGEHPDVALLAMTLVAVIPQFAFISASFTNDTLIMAASAATIYWLARLLSRPATQMIRWWEWALLGVLLGIAALSKLQGLGLLPLAGATVLILAWRRRTWKLLLDAAIWVALPLVIIAGWWYVRNIVLYGDWSGLGHLTALNGRRTKPISPQDFWPEFRGLRYSFWGLFGWFNILLPDWFYVAADLLTLVGVAGLVGAVVRIARRVPAPRLDSSALRIISLLIGWSLITFALLVYWILQATGSQGRLLFPGISAFAILLALGIDYWLDWLPLLGRRIAWGAVLGMLLAVSLYALTQLLPASYAAPAPVATIPATATPLELTIGTDDSIRLRAIELVPGRYHPGETVPVTLFLQAPAPLQHDYQLFIQLLDDQGREVANLTSHPGWGRNPTTLWAPGALYADRYQVPVIGDVGEQSPLLARVYTGFVNPATEEGENLPLPVRDAAGAEITPFVGDVTLASWRAPQLDALHLQPAGSTFGNVIQLSGIALPDSAAVQTGATVTTTLVWNAVGQPATDYTAFVHLVDGNGQQVAGFDQAPAAGRFPTSAWRAGDRIVSTYPLVLRKDLAPGSYALWAGLYETQSNGAIRLPLTDAAALSGGDGQVQIGTLAIPGQ